MDLLTHFRMLASYNQAANLRLYRSCGQLDDYEYRLGRPGPFGSIHRLLNHILLGDRIWMARFEGAGATTPPLNTVLYDNFADLQAAREQMDSRIVLFFNDASDEILSRSYHYLNSQQMPYVERAPIAIAHLFNHQTHHRGQVCVMLASTPVRPPSLDLHRIINPDPCDASTEAGSSPPSAY